VQACGDRFQLSSSCLSRAQPNFQPLRLFQTLHSWWFLTISLLFAYWRLHSQFGQSYSNVIFVFFSVRIFRDSKHHSQSYFRLTPTVLPLFCWILDGYSYAIQAGLNILNQPQTRQSDRKHIHCLNRRWNTNFVATRCFSSAQRHYLFRKLFD